MRYLNPDYIFFLYTFLKFKIEGESQINFETFHYSIRTDIPMFLELLIQDKLTTKIIVNIKEINGEEIISTTNKELIKKESAYMKIFNKYAGCHPYDYKYDFSFIANINKGGILNFLKEYFKYWDENHISMKYYNYYQPSKQKEKFGKILNNLTDDYGNSFQYTFKNLQNIDEISMIMYLYVNNYLNITNDCLTILNPNRLNDIFFLIDIDKKKLETLKSYKSIQINLDYSKILDGDNNLITTLTKTEQKIIEFLKRNQNESSIENISKITIQTELALKQSIKELNKKFKQNNIFEQICISSNYGNNIYTLVEKK